MKDQGKKYHSDLADPISKWKQEFARFDDQLNELYSNPDYREKYVAMKDGKIIDTDEEELSLAVRISKRFPDEVVIVAKVTKDPLPIHEVSSPELA